MLTTVRAAIAVAMLLGFYVLALAIIAGLGWLTFAAFANGLGVAGSKLGYVTIAVAVGIGIALWRVIRAKPEPPSGLPVSPQQSPELWAIVTELAGQLKTRRPDQILLVPDVNAAVGENARLLGLLGGRRTMLIGVPLLQAFSVAQLRSVLAHELGHYSGSHTRLGPVAYRGRMAMIATVQNLSGLVAWLFKQYARIYVLVEKAVSRRQELEADRASVQVAGRSTAQSTLRELPVIDAAWDFYFGRYIAPGWEAGYAPDDIFGGFGELLRNRSDELARLRAQAPPSEGSRWDSHPPVAARIEAMNAMPDLPVVVDQRPATTLIPGFEQACAALASMALKIDSRQVLPWEQFTVAAMTAATQETADEIYRGVARSTRSSQADLGTVLDLSAAGRLGTIGGPLTESPADAFGALVSLAAVRSGAATWRHSWAGAPTLVRPDGSPFDVGEIVRLAVSPPSAVAARARLAELGIDVAQASLVQATATAKGGDVVGGIANMKVDGAWHDVLILTNGLILAAGPKSTDGGKARLRALATSAPVEELARVHRFIAYEDVAAVTVNKEVPVRLEVALHDGRSVKLEESWTGDLLTRQCRENLVAGLRSHLSQGGVPAEITWSK